jgi:molecular chaperone DnaK (HSP70)
LARREDTSLCCTLCDSLTSLDFSHTGVSWTYYPATAPEIFMVDNWTDPNMSNANHDKVPSEIVYDEDGRPKLWGFEARSNKETTPIRWFKVLMDEDHMQDGLEKEVILNTTKQSLAAIQKTAEDVVIDYLRCVWKFALETIRAPHQKDMADKYRFRIVITVPAIWNPQAMEKTRQAIQKVLANEKWPVEVVQEPTAAAIYTLNHMMKFESHAIHVGDCYLVCDAG